MKIQKSINRHFPINLLRLLLLSVFLLLSFFAHRTPFFGLDLQISRLFQSFHQPLFYWMMNMVSEVGDDYHLPFLIGTAATLLYLVGLKKEALKATISASVAYFIGAYVKYLVGRPRPGDGLVQIQEALSDNSFPSLHVLVFTVFFGYILYLGLYEIKTFWRKRFLIFSSLFLILSIGISRIYLGVHWASDTIGGYLLGAFLLSYVTENAKR